MAPKSNDNTPYLMMAAGVSILALIGFYLWLEYQPTEQIEVSGSVPVPMDIRSPSKVLESLPEPAPAPVVETMPLPAEPSKPLIAAPTKIDGSDEVVRRVAGDLAPALLDWLTPDQQVRKWVLSIDLMADGEVPKQYRPLAYSMERFAVETVHDNGVDQLFLAESNFNRTHLLVQAVTAIDPALAVHYYKGWLPLLEKAYAEQGKSGSFDQRLTAALDRVIAVQPLMVKPALVRKGGVMYAYADSQYENASDVEKMCWRMGADNSVKLQAWLKQVRQYR